MRTGRLFRRPTLLRTGVVACAAVALGTLAPTALARPSIQSLRVADMVNDARAGAGIDGVAYDQRLSSIAHRHSLEMAETGSLHHSRDLPDRVPGPWRVLGENIGVAATLDDVFQAFMESEEHRAHVERSDYSDVGVGVVLDDFGAYWVTLIFRG